MKKGLLFILFIWFSTSVFSQTGSSIYEPIYAGSLSACGGNYFDVQNNSPGYFGNDYGNLSDDIFHMFTLNAATEINISHCGSNFDTYLYLLDASGNLIASNDDNGPSCSGTQASITVSIPAGDYYVVSEGYISYYGDINLSISTTSAGGPTSGTIMANAIDAGILNQVNLSFYDSRDNSCYGDNYGRPSEDIFYKFTLTSNSEISISHCGSAFDTYLHLLDFNGNLIASNDDNGPLCSGLQASIKLNLTAGTYYVVSEGFSSSGIINTQISLQKLQSNLNWVSSKTYDEDGVMIAAAKVFYNQNGIPIQTQVKNISANQVLASEELFDAVGRSTGNTLSAPINSESLDYKENFVTNASGHKYNFLNFDLVKTNNPDPVQSTTPGTLGYYYSNDNSVEPYVPATTYPYSRTDFYHDGTGASKRNASVGEGLRMGTGHESSGNSVGVVNELNFYNQIRTKFFQETVIGSGNSLQGNAMQQFSIDGNGKQIFSITDLQGKTLVSGRSDGLPSLTVVNNVHVSNRAVYTYNLDWLSNFQTLNFSPYINITGSGNLTVYKTVNNGPAYTFYNGPANDFNSFAAYDGNFRFESDLPFFLSYEIPVNGNQVAKKQNCMANLGSEGKKQFHYFKLFQSSPVIITGTGWKLYDMSNTEQEIIGFTSGNNLAIGYYKLSIPGNGEADISYTNIYSDLSFNFYNQLGHLIASINPEGVKQIVANGLNSYSTFQDVPFKSTYEYDVRGRMLANTSTDAGRTEFIYRRDGKMRFSQNSEQRKTGSFSYTDYDRWGRGVELGLYSSGNITFAFAKSNSLLQESLYEDGALSAGTKQEQVKVHYDTPDIGHGLSSRVQDPFLLKSAVSWTENDNCKTWYNYDEQGRISWVIKSISGLGNKTVDYTYFPGGGVEKVDYQRDVPSERFVHHYEYDADSRLITTYSSLNGIDKTLQAKYYYYLHGPLKRVELGTDLQGLDYTYTPQGWLKAINHPDLANDPGKDGLQNGFAPDAFAMTLEYFGQDYNRSGSGIGSIATGTGTELYAGNIAGLSWKSQKPEAIVSTYGGSINNAAMFTFKYNNKYQFEENKYGIPNFTNNDFSQATNGANKEHGLIYDLHGNIQALNRSNSLGGSSGFTYHYIPNTNKLQSVDNYASYEYNDLGQMISQERSNGQKLYLVYNVLGKVIYIYSDLAHTQLQVSYIYDESGQRVSKTDHIQNITTHYVYDLAGNVLSIYDNNGGSLQQKEIPLYASSRIGLYNRNGNDYRYELSDNLGNVRVVINQTKISSHADVMHYSDYYPFGSPITLSGNDYPYGYQGQFAEIDKETGWYNFDARMYDAAIGRWMSTDPAAQFYSPYVGMGNNPVSAVDPDGSYSGFAGFVKWASTGFKGDFRKATTGPQKGEYYISTTISDNSTEHANIHRQLDFGSSLNIGSMIVDLVKRNASYTSTVTSRKHEIFNFNSRFGDVLQMESFLSKPSSTTKKYLNINKTTDQDGNIKFDASLNFGPLSFSYDTDGKASGSAKIGNYKAALSLSRDAIQTFSTSMKNSDGSELTHNFSTRPGGYTAGGIVVAVGLLVAPEITIPVLSRAIPSAF